MLAPHHPHPIPTPGRIAWGELPEAHCLGLGVVRRAAQGQGGGYLPQNLYEVTARMDNETSKKLMK